MKNIFKNRKGYMLVEIVLASAIAFGIAAYMINITIKVKNKNDDMLVEMQAATDRAIIINKLMQYLESEQDAFTCNIGKNSNNQLNYESNLLDNVSSYVKIGNVSCDKTTNDIKINIELSVPQLPDKNFDVLINYVL